MSYFSFWNKTIDTENVPISSLFQDWLLSEERQSKTELQKWHRINWDENKTSHRDNVSKTV